MRQLAGRYKGKQVVVLHYTCIIVHCQQKDFQGKYRSITQWKEKLETEDT